MYVSWSNCIFLCHCYACWALPLTIFDILMTFEHCSCLYHATLVLDSCFYTFIIIVWLLAIATCACQFVFRLCTSRSQAFWVFTCIFFFVDLIKSCLHFVSTERVITSFLLNFLHKCIILYAIYAHMHPTTVQPQSLCTCDPCRLTWTPIWGAFLSISHLPHTRYVSDLCKYTFIVMVDLFATHKHAFPIVNHLSSCRTASFYVFTW